MNYGIPYMGSKTGIAEDIISILPAGKRFVDLFGGGFAMSHCAKLSGKFEQVYYNELNPIVVELIRKAINGDYNYDKFKPEFVTREKFFELKDKDGYVAYIWSFGNNPKKGYLFCKDIEEYKKALHNAVVFENFDEALKISKELKNINGKTIQKRRISCCRIVKNVLKSRCDLEQLQRLEQLERLQRLQQLEQLERLIINCGSYKDYIYKDGDVVYCDPPYQGTGKYCDGGFNHQEFYDWVASRDYTVYFSSYEISDNRFHKIWSKAKRTTLSSTSNNTMNMENIYCNKKEKLNLFSYLDS